MSISFHCEACKKKIKAPDTTGGKWGNCPFCNHRCYIPLPRIEDEAGLTLVPLDRNGETIMAEMMRQTHDLTQSLLGMEALPDKKHGDGKSGRLVKEKEVIKNCVIYLRQVADGKLAGAEQTFLALKKTKKSSIRVFSSMARAERPEPELVDIPLAVLKGLIQDVYKRLI
ncbi:MAG: hypothetical protein DRP56_04165 [Planctomycetota bacterium]|nr:MAG: hypothetical protein DRP56_04165 [Planctomycetota bacterium]